MATLSELVIAMGFDVKSESFQTFSKFIGGIDAIKEGLEAVGKIATGGKGFKDFLFGTASKGQDLINMSKRMKMSTEAIQEWQYAAEKAGASWESIAGDIMNLQTKGIRGQKYLLALSDRISKANSFQLQILKMQYGISEDYIKMSLDGSKKILASMDEVKKSGGIVSEENLQKGKEFNESLIALKTNISGIAQTVASEYLPKMQEWTNSILTWLQDSKNQEKAIKGLELALGGLAASALLSGLVTLAINIKKVAGALLFLKTASFALMASPLGLILTALAGVTAGTYGLWNWINQENKEFAERHKNAFEAHEKYGEPSGSFLKGLFSSPDEYLKDLPIRKDLIAPQYQTPINTGTTSNVGEINITIMTDEAGSAIAQSIKNYTGIDMQDIADRTTLNVLQSG